VGRDADALSPVPPAPVATSATDIPDGGVVVVVVGAVVVVVGAVVVVVGAVVVVVGALVVVVGAVVGVGAVVVVVGGVPGVTSPLSFVLSSSLLLVAMQTSVDAHETELYWFVVPPVSACHVDPPFPVPASDNVVPNPPTQHVKAFAQLIELAPPVLKAEGTAAQVVPEFVLVARVRPLEPRGNPVAKQTAVPLRHDADSRPPSWPRIDEPDWDQVVPLEVVDMVVAGPVVESSPTATQLDVEEQEIPSKE
jgi:hypothetical protein